MEYKLSPPGLITQMTGPRFRQTPTYYLQRHQTNLIVGWKPCMWRNDVMAVWSAVCRLIRIPPVKLPQVRYAVALPWKQYGQLIFLTLGVFSWLLHSSVGLKLESVVLLKKKTQEKFSISGQRSATHGKMFGFCIFMWSFRGRETSLVEFCQLIAASHKIQTCKNISSLKIVPFYIAHADNHKTLKNLTASVQTKLIHGQT